MDDQNKIQNTSNDDESVEIPVQVHEKVKESVQRLSQEEPDEIVAEYEAKYEPLDKPDDQKAGWRLPPMHRRVLQADPEDISEDERLWAALAHGSALLSIFVAIATGGMGAFLTVFLPLLIYLAFREKSEFVASHAMQAFAAQVVGIVGFMALLIAITVTWVILIIIAALLVIVLVGLLLLPVVIIAGLLGIAGTFILPLGLVVYSMIAAVQAYHGHFYSYPYIGDWVDDQLYGRIENHA